MGSRARRRLLAEHQERLITRCALFDATGRLIAQAEHIPSTWFLPWGLRRSLAWLAERGRTIAPARWSSSTTRTCRDAPQRRHRHPGIYHGDRLVGTRQQGAPYRRRRRGPRVDAARRADLFAEGAVYTPTVLCVTTASSTRRSISSANSRTPKRGPATCARRSPGTTSASAFPRAHRALRHRRGRGGPREGARRRRTAHAGRAARAPRRRRRARRRDGGRARQPSIVLRVRLEKRGDELMLDYTGTRRSVRSAQLGLRRHALGRVLRDPGGDDPRIPMNDGSSGRSRCMFLRNTAQPAPRR